jgi:hypothetical protein
MGGCLALAMRMTTTTGIYTGLFPHLASAVFEAVEEMFEAELRAILIEARK